MSNFKTPAILLRKIEYGDYDLIIHFLTLERGKIAVMAKSAKRSTKRFGGALQLFSILEIVCKPRRGKGLYLLEEADLKDPLHRIRSDVRAMAYASYWVELLHAWVEEENVQTSIYRLLEHSLKQTNDGVIPVSVLSMLFQIRLMTLSGFCPDLLACSGCAMPVDRIVATHIRFDLSRGGLVCPNCECGAGGGTVRLSKGSIKRLQWLQKGQLETAGRLKFPQWSIEEGEGFLEAFVPYHLGRDPKSLRFLRQIRQTDTNSSCVKPK